MLWQLIQTHQKLDKDGGCISDDRRQHQRDTAPCISQKADKLTEKKRKPGIKSFSATIVQDLKPRQISVTLIA
jgi:hypothetical protein